MAPDRIGERLASAGERPNIVVFLVDTLRADWTTPYDESYETTPQVQRWAQEGVVFERYRTQSSWTKMSVASLFTSLWPQSHGIRAYGDGLGAGAVTLAEVLRDAGYRTFAVQTNGWLHQSFGFHQGFDRYVFPAGRGAHRMPKATVWAHADRVYEEALRLVDAHTPDRPLFLYLHFMDVHEYAAPNEFKTYGTDTKSAYLASIRWVDDSIERIASRLDAAGILENALVVFTSDHGEAFGENGRVGHARNVLTKVVSVPLVLRFPFPIEPVRIPGQVRGIDLAPTILDVAGVPIPESFEGRSLLPLITGSVDAAGDDRTSYAGLGLPLYQDARVQEAVNDGSWTLARNVEPDPKPGELLYDRRVDPGENVNLIDREPAQAERMRAVLDAYLTRERAAGVLESDVRIDPGIADKLRALGYMQ